MSDDYEINNGSIRMDVGGEAGVVYEKTQIELESPHRCVEVFQIHDNDVDLEENWRELKEDIDFLSGEIQERRTVILRGNTHIRLIRATYERAGFPCSAHSDCRQFFEASSFKYDGIVYTVVVSASDQDAKKMDVHDTMNRILNSIQLVEGTTEEQAPKPGKN